MSAIAPPRDQFTNTITCPKCGQQGQETWEEAGQNSSLGPDPHLVVRSGDFYERISRKAPYPIEVVCGRCGAVVAG
jgi:hypothetical protein